MTITRKLTTGDTITATRLDNLDGPRRMEFRRVGHEWVMRVVWGEDNTGGVALPS